MHIEEQEAFQMSMAAGKLFPSQLDMIRFGKHLMNFPRITPDMPSVLADEFSVYGIGLARIERAYPGYLIAGPAVRGYRGEECPRITNDGDVLIDDRHILPDADTPIWSHSREGAFVMYDASDMLWIREIAGGPVFQIKPHKRLSPLEFLTLQPDLKKYTV